MGEFFSSRGKTIFRWFLKALRARWVIDLVHKKDVNSVFLLTVVYGSNHLAERKEL